MDRDVGGLQNYFETAGIELALAERSEEGQGHTF